MSEDDIFQNIDTDSELGSSPQPGRHQKGRPKQSKHIVLIVSIVVVLLLLAVAGGYWYVEHHAKQTTTTTHSSAATTQVNTQAVTTPATTTDTTPSGTTAYTSTQQNLNLAFDYPSDWEVSPKQTNATDTTPITVTSPSGTITAADGTSVTGKVIVTIRAGGGQITELSSAATAAQDSTQMAYLHPTATQRQYPYLTYVHFTNGSSVDGTFEEVMITGGDQFTKGTAITSDSLGDVDPLITASFYGCDSTDCSTPSVGTVAITNTTWQNATVFEETAALFSSFKIN